MFFIASSESSTSSSNVSTPLTTPTDSESKDVHRPSFARFESVVYVAPPSLPTIPDPQIPSTTDEAQDGNSPDHWVKRDTRMVRLTGKHPFNAEARIENLFDQGFLTPTALFYVRNHGAVPHVEEQAARDWTVRVHGLVRQEATLSVEDLKRLFPVVTLPVTFVCAGNRRKEQNVVQVSSLLFYGHTRVLFV